MSEGYEDEQKKLKASVTELTAYIETAEQKSADATAFISVVQQNRKANLRSFRKAISVRQ